MESSSGWDIVQIALIVIVGAFVAHYIYMRYTQKSQIRVFELDEQEAEGFANPDGEGGGKDIVVLSNNHLFDAFYAKVYDQVVDGSVREKTEVGMTLGWAKTFRPEASMLQVLDVGSGTGGAG